MRRDLASLERAVFDLVVIGGGITGACLAHDAALRGLSVALVEKADFGGATSAASSKILHSGIRYLQQLELGKLRESAYERRCFQQIAPHLTRYVPFLIPTFRGWLKGRAALQSALAVHALLSADGRATVRDPAKRVPPSRICGKAEAVARAPVLASQPGLTGACLLYESHMHSSERMTLAFVKSAVHNGAVVANYVSAQSLLTEGGRARGITVRDEIDGATFEIRARIVANAAGPWIPALGAAFGAAGLTRQITGFSKGAHLVTRPLCRDVALVLPTRRPQRHVIDRGGRHLFVIPWRDRSLVGTSNAPFAGELDQVRATAADVAELLADLGAALPGVDLSPADVDYAFAGLYPLAEADLRPDVYQASGTYQIVDHGALGDVDGLISVLGMKFTTARKLAELAANLVVRKLDVGDRPGRTATTPLVGGGIDDLPGYLAGAVDRYRDGLDATTVAHLVEHYGTEIDDVLGASGSDLRPTARLCPERECIEAEIAYAVTHEMAQHLDDVVLRRTGLGTVGHPGAACLERAGAIAGALAGWSRSRLDEEVARTAAALTVEQGR